MPIMIRTASGWRELVSANVIPPSDLVSGDCAERWNAMANKLDVIPHAELGPDKPAQWDTAFYVPRRTVDLSWYYKRADKLFG